MVIKKTSRCIYPCRNFFPRWFYRLRIEKSFRSRLNSLIYTLDKFSTIPFLPHTHVNNTRLLKEWLLTARLYIRATDNILSKVPFHTDAQLNTARLARVTIADTILRSLMYTTVYTVCIPRHRIHIHMLHNPVTQQ